MVHAIAVAVSDRLFCLRCCVCSPTALHDQLQCWSGRWCPACCMAMASCSRLRLVPAVAAAQPLLAGALPCARRMAACTCRCQFRRFAVALSSEEVESDLANLLLPAGAARHCWGCRDAASAPLVTPTPSHIGRGPRCCSRAGAWYPVEHILLPLVISCHKAMPTGAEKSRKHGDMHANLMVWPAGPVPEAGREQCRAAA